MENSDHHLPSDPSSISSLPTDSHLNTPENHGQQFQPRVINSISPRRQSRLPIFEQVRMMLHHASNKSQPASPVAPLVASPITSTSTDRPKWDAYTGELSVNGHPSRVQPSTYVHPYEDGATTAPAPAPPRTPPRLRLGQHIEASPPISLLHDESIRDLPKDPSDWSPVSPISQGGSRGSLISAPLTPHRGTPLQPQTPTSANISKQIKRKPAPGSPSKSENIPPPPEGSSSPEVPSESNFVFNNEPERHHPPPPPEQPDKSHFSWTTYAPSVTPARPSADTNRRSIDTMMSQQTRVPPAADFQTPKSRFSWSTVNTTASRRGRHQSSPPTSPVPAIPDEHAASRASPPVQSILSRRRPIQRQDRPEWEPPQRERKASLPLTSVAREPGSKPSKRSASLDPTSILSPAAQLSTTTNEPTTGPSKALPPPPELTRTADPDRTRIDTLLKHEQDLALQRRNTEKAIAELERLEAASPLSISWTSVRDARERLLRNRARLAEIVWEQREVGVAICRARRKEGSEEGLWVRRVTG